MKYSIARTIIGLGIITMFSNFSGCSCLYHKLERNDNYRIVCTEPKMNDGLMVLDFTIYIKPKVFDKKATYRIKPLLATGDTTIFFNTHILTGELIESLHPTVSWQNGGGFRFTDSTRIDINNIKEYEILAKHYLTRGTIDEPIGRIDLDLYLMHSNIKN
ncbi:hypothetical protein [Carboxylicivirga marina]|uniref:Gliding motility lipoprotein GldH n=2 Tax=Carboxylicivirga marina TaxID=2800988 RepID=A0ABS1HLM5_9BACT|nr:hypothetical protein [Carboxylicivirga marina]MBK3518059.1 hypothetical protein [Carboxylicivirga marina]